MQFKALLQPLQECNYSANSIKMMTWGNINHVLALPPPQTLDPQVSSNLFSKIGILFPKIVLTYCEKNSDQDKRLQNFGYL